MANTHTQCITLTASQVRQAAALLREGEQGIVITATEHNEQDTPEVTAVVVNPDYQPGARVELI